MARYRIVQDDGEEEAQAPIPARTRYRIAKDEDPHAMLRESLLKQAALPDLLGYGQDVLSGVEKAGEGLAKAVYPDAPTSNILERPDKSQFAEGIGRNLPYAIAGGTNLLPRLASVAIGGKMLKLPVSLGQIIAQGAYGAAEAKPNERLEGAANQAAMTAGLGLGGKAIIGASKLGGKAIIGASKLARRVPSAYEKALQEYAMSSEKRHLDKIKNSISPEDIAENERVAAGTSTPLHAILGSPSMQKHFENRLMPKLGAEISEPLKEVKSQIYNKGENVIDQFGGASDIIEAPKNMVEGLRGAKNEATKAKNALYKTVDDIAKKTGFTPKLTQTLATSINILKDIKNTGAVSGSPNVENTIHKILKNVESAKPVITFRDPLTGIPTYGKGKREPIAYKELRFLQTRLDDLIAGERRSTSMQNRDSARKLISLRQALKTDLKESLQQHGSEELNQAIKHADQEYSANYAGFIDKDVNKYITGYKDPSKLFQAVMQHKGMFDKNLTLDKISKHLTPEQRQSMANYFLRSQAYKSGGFNPTHLSQAVGKLRASPQLFDAIVTTPDAKQSLLDWKRLHDINKTAMNIDYNPHTGIRGLEMAAEDDPLAKAVSMAAQGKGIGNAALSLGGHILTKATNRTKAKFEAERMLSEEHRKRIIDEILKRGKEDAH